MSIFLKKMIKLNTFLQLKSSIFWELITDLYKIDEESCFCYSLLGKDEMIVAKFLENRERGDADENNFCSGR
jgi:hypothetical protein